jgi:hypothetical protein
LEFDDLRERLLAGGIAPRHVRRYLRELREHLDDLTAQQRVSGYDGEDAASRARARLGSDQELAAAMLAQKGFRSLAARAPWAVFLILPPVATIAIGSLFMGSLVLIGLHFGFLGLHEPLPPQWYQMLAADLVLAANLTMMPLTAILFVAIAQRQRLNPIWPLAAALVLLLLFVHSDVLFAPDPKGSMDVSANPIFMQDGWMMLVENWRLAGVQYALTMLPVLWLWRRRLMSPAN